MKVGNLKSCFITGPSEIDKLNQKIKELEMKIFENKINNSMREDRIKNSGTDFAVQTDIVVEAGVNRDIQNIVNNSGKPDQNNGSSVSPAGGADSPTPPAPPAFIPPPPPTPKLVKRRSSFKKFTPESKLPLKTVNVIKIPNIKIQQQNTVWKSINDDNLFKTGKIDTNELTRLFSRNSASYAGTLKKSARTIQNRDSQRNFNENSHHENSPQFSILPEKKLRNWSIFLHRPDMKKYHSENFAEFKKIMLNCDQRNLFDVETLQQLIRLLPTNEEFCKLANTSDFLSEPEKKLFELSQIERLEQRLECMIIFKSEKDEFTKIHKFYKDLKFSSDLLMKKSSSKSDCVTILLELVLGITNFMNKKSKGVAIGVELSTILKLSEVRSKLDGRITLIHYVANTLDKICSEKLAKLNFKLKINTESQSDVVQGTKTMKDGLLKISEEILYFNENVSLKSNRDDFMSVFVGLRNRLETSLLVVQRDQAEASVCFLNVKRYFLVGDGVSSNEFFGYFSKFLDLLEAAQKSGVETQVEPASTKNVFSRSRNATLPRNMKLSKFVGQRVKEC